MKISQDYEYAGRDRWKWRAWIDAPNTELNGIKYVVWILHPTFANPRVQSKNRKAKFLLTSSGWGTFELYAEVHQKNGTQVQLTHQLVLEYPDDEDDSDAAVSSTGSPAKQLNVFLSYGSADSAQAAVVKRAMLNQGVNVIDAATSVTAGQDIEAAIRRKIRSSDAVVGLLGEDTASPFLVQELELGRKMGRPIITLSRPGAPKVFGFPAALASYGQNFDLDLDDEHASVQALLDNIGSGKEV